MSSTDKLLWKQLIEGNKQALEKIYQSEVEYLFNYCRRITADQNLIEDAIQELFIEIWDRRSKLSITDSIRPYLLTSIRRKVIYLLKRQGKTNFEVDEALAFKSDAGIDSAIIEKENQSERKKLLRKAMEGLSKRQREAIYHKFFNECSYEEICQIMGLNYQSARNLISSGLKRMKEDLGNVLFIWILLSTILYLVT
jgi:RNA polymerase sigma factor (sigma-70 family)